MTEITELLLKVLELSKDLTTVCRAVDSLVVVHSEDDHKHIYAQTNVGKALSQIKPSLLKMIRKELENPDIDADAKDLYVDVQSNLEQFIEYKKSTLK